jgi:hypothetical protein
MALVSCATPASEAAAPAAPALESAGATVKSWGATLRDWKVDAAGHVEHVSGERVGGDRTDIIIETRRLTLSAAQMQQLATAVGRVETILAQPEQCSQRLTDGPYGTFRWNRGSGEVALPFDGNCVEGRDYQLVSAIFAADAIVDEAAKAVEPVEKHPLAER